MYRFIELAPQHQVEYVQVDTESFMANGRCEPGGLQGVSQAFQVMMKADDVVLPLRVPSHRWTGGIPTTVLDGLGCDPFVLTNHHLDCPEAGAIASFREPEYWLVGNSVFSVLNAAIDVMDQVLQAPTDISSLSIDWQHFTPMGASFELYPVYDGQSCRLQFAIERLSTYQSRREHYGLHDRFQKMPHSWYQYQCVTEAFVQDYSQACGIDVADAQQVLNAYDSELNQLYPQRFLRDDAELTPLIWTDDSTTGNAESA